MVIKDKLAETKIVTLMQVYLGEGYNLARRTAQGWEIWYGGIVRALITDEAILRAYDPRRKYTHNADCLYHADNKSRLDDYWNSYDRSPGGCDCPYELLPPYGFSIIKTMLAGVKERVEEEKRRQLNYLRQVGRMCGSDPNV